MNQALQRRHEQLERWKQNEANIELTLPKEPTNKERKIRTSSNDNSNKDNRKKYGINVKFSNAILFLAACGNGDIEECERLLRSKFVDINTTTNDGLTGLHEAAIAGNSKMVEFLLKNGAQIDCVDNEGWTPLHAAASLGQTEVVEVLLAHNADPTLVNCENVLAYDLARNDQVRALIGSELRNENLELLRLQERHLIEYDIARWLKTGIYDERSHPVTNANVLHVLASKGHIELTRRLLESDVLRRQIDIDARDNEGFTPLIAAAHWGQTGIVQLLIEHGANALAQSNQGYRFDDFLDSSFAALMKDLFYTKQLERKHDPTILKEKKPTTTVSTPTSNIRRGANELVNQQQPASGANSRSSSVLSLDSSLQHDDHKSSVDGDEILDISNTTSSHVRPKQKLARSNTKPLLYQPHPDNNHSSSDELLDSSDNVPSQSVSLESSLSIADTLNSSELRRSYKELLIENEKLTKQLKEYEDNEKRRNQDWSREKRQLQRKISELEEENKQLEQWKHESQRLKDENSSLLRVISKISK